MRPAALHAMERALEETWGNAGAIYAPAAAARKLLEDARGILAESIGAERREIYFTSGGTESDNWALVAAAEEAARSRGERPGGYDSQFPDALSGCGGKGFIPDSAQMPHIITTAVEHHAVLETCNYLERRGFAVTRLPVDAEGIVTPGAVLAAMRPATCLVSVMAVNNEIGTMEPVSEISEAIRQYNKAG